VTRSACHCQTHISCKCRRKRALSCNDSYLLPAPRPAWPPRSAQAPMRTRLKPPPPLLAGGVPLLRRPTICCRWRWACARISTSTQTHGTGCPAPFRHARCLSARAVQAACLGWQHLMFLPGRQPCLVECLAASRF
jgi:hypothetical protein